MKVYQGGESQETEYTEYKENKSSAAKSSTGAGKYIVLIIVMFLAIFLLSQSIYIVREDEVATERRLGAVQRIIIDEVHKEMALLQNETDDRFSDVIIDTQKGLKFKVPFITTVEKNTNKLMTYMSNTARINTQDKIRYDINMYAQWRITHPAIFASSLGTVESANAKIDEITYAVVIDRMNRLQSNSFLRDKEAIDNILSDARETLNMNLADQGIMLVDIDVYRTILPESNIESTHNKMVDERNAIAQQIRSEGLEYYQNTVADTDRQVAEIKAEAYETSEIIRGQADAEALEIYAAGFSQDPEFYQLWRTLRAYEHAIDEDTVIYLDRNNEFLRIFSGNN